MRPMTVFLSATGKDLETYRRAVTKRMGRLDFFRCDASENWGARDVGALPFCRERVLDSDVLVGLIGNYRGWEPAGDNAKRSITQMEYEWAVEGGKSRLLYVAPETFAAGADLEMTPEQAGRQTAFRKKVLNDPEAIHDIDFYEGRCSHPEALAAGVTTALANVLARKYLELLHKIEETPGGPTPAPAEIDVGPPQPTPPQDVLSELMRDPDFAELTADPKSFNLKRLEAAIEERAARRIAEAAAGEGAAAEKRLEAAADFKRLAELTGFYDLEKARSFYVNALETNPADGVAVYQYAELSRKVEKSSEAEAVLAKLPVAVSDPQGAFWARIGAGNLHLDTGKLDLASQSYKHAHDIADLLAKTDPDNIIWQRDLAVSHEKIGGLREEQGDFSGALEAFAASRKITDRLVTIDPDNPVWQRDLCASNARIGDLFKDQGDLTDALEAFTACRDIAKHLVTVEPDNPDWQLDLCLSHDKIGDVLKDKGDLTDALNAFNASHNIAERLVTVDPCNVDWQRELALSLGRVAMVEASKGKKKQALDKFKEGKVIIARLCDVSGDNAALPKDRAWFDQQIAALDVPVQQRGFFSRFFSR